MSNRLPEISTTYIIPVSCQLQPLRGKCSAAQGKNGAGALLGPRDRFPLGGGTPCSAAGASAVERRSTKLVFSSYSWCSRAGGSDSTSFNKAWNAIRANSFCDI